MLIGNEIDVALVKFGGGAIKVVSWSLTFDMSAAERARSGICDVRSMEWLGIRRRSIVPTA